MKSKFSAHQPLLFPRPLALLFAFPFIVLLLAARQPDFELDAPFIEVQIQRDKRVARTVDFGSELADFLPVQQQFAGSDRIGRDMGGRRGQRADVRADKKHLITSDDDVRFFQICPAGADGFCFPPLENNSSFMALFDEIIMEGLAVFGDAHTGHFKA